MNVREHLTKIAHVEPRPDISCNDRRPLYEARGDLASDFELVAVARTTQDLLERRAVRCHVVMRLAANSLSPCRRLDVPSARPIAGKPGKSAAFVLLRRRTDRQEKQADRQRSSLHPEDAPLRKYP